MANAQVQVDFVRNKRGGQSLVLGGYRYVVKNRKQDRTYWVCSTRGCFAKAATREGILMRNEGNHCHPPDNTIVPVDRLMQNIRKRCRDEVTPIPSIFAEETASLRDADWDEDTTRVVEKTPTFQTCKTALYKERGQFLPPIPKTRTQVHLDGKWTETKDGQQFLQIDDGEDSKILVFATHQNLSDLCRVGVIYGDGTFYTCPSIFHQLYTLHGFINGEMYPLLFAFLPGKSRQIYERLFTLVRIRCPQLGFNFSPNRFFMDFEAASRVAVTTIFPDADVKGCFFHFTQCVWRKAQATGLAIPYKENEDVHRLVRRAAVLPLVPVLGVADVWFEALNGLEDVQLPVDVSVFTDYITEQWVETDKETWNHFNTEGPRTTNHLEGWHSKLKKLVQHSHPNIYRIITTLQQTEASNSIKQIQYAAGGTRPVKRGKYRDLENRLNTLKLRLQAGEITVVQYADAASYLLHI